MQPEPQVCMWCVWVCDWLSVFVGGGVWVDWAPATTRGAENPIQSKRSKPYNLNPKPHTLDRNPHVI